jgi:hypothetical protein
MHSNWVSNEFKKLIVSKADILKDSFYVIKPNKKRTEEDRISRIGRMQKLIN